MRIIKTNPSEPFLELTGIGEVEIFSDPYYKLSHVSSLSSPRNVPGQGRQGRLNWRLETDHTRHLFLLVFILRLVHRRPLVRMRYTPKDFDTRLGRLLYDENERKHD